MSEETPDAPLRAKRAKKLRRVDPQHVATILAYTALHGRDKAAEEFKVGRRSIDRWKAKVERGEWPEVARLGAEQRSKALARSSDLLTETFDKALKALQEKLTEMTGRQVVGAIKICGELIQGRDFLSPEDVDRPRQSEPPPGDEAGAGPASGRTGFEKGSAHESNGETRH